MILRVASAELSDFLSGVKLGDRVKTLEYADRLIQAAVAFQMRSSCDSVNHT